MYDYIYILPTIVIIIIIHRFQQSDWSVAITVFNDIIQCLVYACADYKPSNLFGQHFCR